MWGCDAMTHSGADAAVVTDVRDGVATITLNEPRSLNAFSADLTAGLNDALDATGADPAVRCLLLIGAGRAFCSGVDLRVVGHAGPTAVAAFVSRVAATIDRVEANPKPVVAAVHGLAVGAGLELMLAADVVLVARGAKINEGHAKLGIVPPAGTVTRLLRTVGPLVAKQLVLTGASLSAEDVFRVGLATMLVEPSELAERAREQARLLASRDPAVTAGTKSLLRTPFGVATPETGTNDDNGGP